MINIELTGLIKEDAAKQISNQENWIEWRALSLLDKDENRPIAEWFYIAACSQTYYDEILEDGPLEGYVIQETFDEAKLLNEAHSRFDSLKFEDWDDFYAKMKKLFIYED